MKKSRLPLIITACLLGTGLLLTGCQHDDNRAKRTFEITVTNLTNNQPFSPIAVALHQDTFSAITPGQMASVELEKLAEGGDNSDYLAALDNHADVNITTSGTGIIAPGTAETVSLTSKKQEGFHLSLASMLVNTNDAFAAVRGVDLSTLSTMEEINVSASAYDAGTEGNSEAMADIPGPAGGGEGFNTARDDRNFIAVHPGIISVDDGLATSVLNSSHRFDNPVARITIKRIK
jgi:hypothetical protein